MALLYEFFGLVVLVGGVYFLWRGVGGLETGSLVSGLLTLVIGIIVFRSGLELVKVGAATRVAASGGAARPESVPVTQSGSAPPKTKPAAGG